jgi:hypothetical protein
MRSLDNLNSVSYEALVEHVHRIVRSGNRGHLHTTLPGCAITGSPHRAIILEATDEGVVYAFFDDQPIEERARPLAMLLHGAESVPDGTEILEPASEAVDRMVTRMREGKGHFHILNPTCLVNPHPGRWTILFEDSEWGPMESISDDRPLADIRWVERLIYA